jgi:hypothetical protein
MYQTIGQMEARYIGETDGVHQWGYKTAHVDSSADLDPGAPEYLIEIVLPDSYPSGGPYPVLYLGGVNTVPGVHGDPLRIAQQEGIHNTYGCILVSNTWKSIPWYGTKNDSTRRYDTHIKWNIFPLLVQEYNASTDREDRLVMGFSKSGWGALSLILKSPTYFGYAAAWDAPWDMAYGSWGSGDAFGTEARFNSYDPKQILAANVAAVNDRERLWISAGKTFLTHHAPMVTRLVEQDVPHRARYLEAAAHEWNPEWMNMACRELFDMRSL